MNSGVRDAHNLAWKLAAVVSGQLGDALLDSYETERRDHAAEMIQLAIRMGQVMMPRGRAQALAFQTFFRALALYPAARSYFAEMKYKPKPRFNRGFLLAPKSGLKESLVGKLFPQALVMTGAGLAPLDDVLGDGFALIAPPGTPPQMLADLRPSEVGKLPIRTVACWIARMHRRLKRQRWLRGIFEAISRSFFLAIQRASTCCVRTATWPRFFPSRKFSRRRMKLRR